MALSLRALGVVHPFPSALNAAVAFALALVAGAGVARAAALAIAILGIEFGIGATNDLVDERLDAATKPSKPIPSGVVTRRWAAVIAVGGTGSGLLLAALHGPALVPAAALVGAGLAYNFGLKRSPFSWLPYSVALPAIPLYAWLGGADTLPPRAELLIPMAALAGPALQLANGVVDQQRDAVARVPSLAATLGRSRSLGAMVILQLVIHGLAWATLVPFRDVVAALPVVLASGLTVVGVRLSASPSEALRERGWESQAVAIGLLAIGWLAAAGRPP